ncbi:MAG: argininosuccinate synthase, partial [Defluviitaleaceae bacterium]|nr:argininosuccinate synthase [Defluviitaleaceae bacterium]
MNKEIKKIVLAYSGGLDTSIITTWLKENYGEHLEVIAVSGHLGQDAELEGIEERAKIAGVNKLYVENLQEELVNDFIFPMLKAGAKYEGYLLGTAIARPSVAKRLVDIALKEGADAICHGCTGKGNDQVRFELTIQALAPGMKVIAPWREWNIASRDDAIDYAEKHDIKLKITRETNYSKDMNLWHLSHEGMDLEDPNNEPSYNKEGFLEMGVSPEQAPDVAEYVTLDFEAGIPVALNGEQLDGVTLIKTLNQIAGKHGVGIFDVVENRLVGMKSRGVYETPGGTVLYHAHTVLESICLDKETMHEKEHLALKYAEIVYNGKWYTPLREAFDAFVNKTQETVTGTVKLKLYKGNIINAGVTSPYSLYSEAFASFNEDDVYDQSDAQGFINLYGLPIKMKA